VLTGQRLVTPSRPFVGGRSVAGVAAETERARSFGAVAAEYAEHRPGYPAAAVEWALAPAPGSDVLDLGAGTGKLTAALLERPGVRVRAVDPDPAMLAELRRRFPAAEALEGSAEAVPLPAGSVDAVVVGQAWHWFDPERALPEIARVLRPRGVLAVLWNDDDSVEWMAGCQAALQVRSRVRNGRGAGPGLPEHPAFAPYEHSSHPNPQRTTVDGLVATLATHSWALIIDPAQRDAAFARMRAYLAARPETSAGEFELPMVTEVLRALRR
jgi:SAM-dependent methyltransferase